MTTTTKTATVAIVTTRITAVNDVTARVTTSTDDYEVDGVSELLKQEAGAVAPASWY